MQCEYVAFPCKVYIMKDKTQRRWSNNNETFRSSKSKKIFTKKKLGHTAVSAIKASLRYITERDVNVFDWPGNSADLTPIEEVWNIMKKKSGSKQ